ncbi:IMP dehydrogenase [Arcanobacterium wilhelmae]|uniref:IMP dehydrogenase n=1 Tax=Arcanobacterium wilhelmae TaxID=1803177 RepID=A0ABT9NCI4_9ACTO|nr:GuaB3 family IMP dehydrogenase-related protein [Arcanobacterium wilhelmae]MDP9801432.1 IMP dehydrogenase [Arcanobacterium wilhelmae]WFN90767.1 GuaB3 family IMP dehydrogenase-related protein [Arcanobacterium wilhelmae]
MANEIEIGRGKRATAGYSFDDIAVVPSRRTRDAADVSVTWQLDANYLEVPILGAPMDSVTSPSTAIELSRLGGIGVLDLEGLWTRYEDPTPQFEEIAAASEEEATGVLQRAYAEPIKPELITQRLRELREADAIVAGALSPQRTSQYWDVVADAGVDLFVIRGTTVSAEHVSSNAEPLNLKRFIYDLDVPVIVGGVASYTAALHLMRTGAAGVLAGFGGGATSANRRTVGVAVPMATTVAEVAAARREYMDETGGRYVHVIADGQISTSGDLVKAIACGADGVMLGTALARAEEAPGRGYHWGAEARHATLPRGERVAVGSAGSLETVINGPASDASGRTNLVGALKRAMAMTGYSDVKEFQRVSVSVGANR